MVKLDPLQFGDVVLSDMTPDQRITVAAKALSEISHPDQFAALREVAHRIARHADHLERLFVDQLPGSLGGQCLPDNANEPASGHFPQDADPSVILGAFLEAE